MTAATLAVAVFGLLATTTGAAADPEAKFTWTLPRTVIDATITYTFEDCDDRNGVSVTIKPTLVARPVPDSVVGTLDISSSTLQSWTSDHSVTIKTFQNSHILQSIGATPVSQAATIANNIFSGIGKIAALVLGVAPLAASTEVTREKCGSASADKDKIVRLKGTLVGLQQAILDATTEEQRKAAVAKVDAYQTVLASWTIASAAAHTLTLQATIDPGFTPIDVLDPTKRTSTRPADINPNGLIAMIVPTQKQIEESGWIKKGLQIDRESFEKLRVNLYMDFGQTIPRAQASIDKARGQTEVDDQPGGHLYREVAYIPVYIYAGTPLDNWPTGGRGMGTTWPGVSNIVSQNEAKQNKMLGPPVRFPFGQYGRSMGLPVTAGFLKNQDWSITFLESGEITETKFVNKGLGVAASGMLNSAINTANAIAAEERAARAANSDTARLKAENAELQARIDNMNLQEQLQKLLAKQTSATQATAGSAPLQ
ncbi:hypothetical protein DXH78_17660 [Undibacter mobilis]|uniref:Uncharacterized protein n=2 Tax=Undibacter mobilis TaxID=2292256 RepID=A0A371B0K7_9BRAD|nr:hypothetical protein DXH78_17660 [Undibacter mobilis]